MVIPFLFAPYGRDWLSANVTLTLRAAGEFFLDVGQFLKVLLESDTTTANLRQKERRCTGGTSLERHRPVAAHRLRQVVRVRDGLRMEAVENKEPAWSVRRAALRTRNAPSNPMVRKPSAVMSDHWVAEANASDNAWTTCGPRSPSSPPVPCSRSPLMTHPRNCGWRQQVRRLIRFKADASEPPGGAV